ncbi:MAG: arsenic efflux protein [Clostridia bacterium]|nr:arsenic efflux protein [Clostridia bacterium]
MVQLQSFLAHSSHDDVVVRAFEEIFLHGILDTLKLVPFLFITYLIMEFIEHKAEEKTEHFIKKAGKFGPAVGGIIGAVPQCGFSAAASNFFAGRVISIGTLIAVFLSTSDEMLPILISESVPVTTLLIILLYKAVVGMAVGFIVDLILRKLGRGKEEINIDAICEEDNCHCEKGLFHSALHHTITITLFILIVTFIINALVFFIGEETLALAVSSVPVLSHFIAAIVGLVPNCAASVVLSTLCVEGLISVGVMTAGLFSSAGIGLLVLFRINKNLKQNLTVTAILVACGFVFGMLLDLLSATGIFGM